MVPMLRLGLIMPLISPTCRTISFFRTTPAYQGQLQALHTRQAKRVEEEPKAPCGKTGFRTVGNRPEFFSCSSLIDGEQGRFLFRCQVPHDFVDGHTSLCQKTLEKFRCGKV